MRKRLVNGVEAELGGEADIRPMAGRLLVRTELGLKSALVRRDGPRVLVSLAGRTYVIEPAAAAAAAAPEGGGELRAPMPGQVVAVLAEPGQAVEAGDKVVVIEAMKMQQALCAPFDGVVAEVNALAGAQVDEGALLARVEAFSADH
jgi:3-methylcrotonyl-CoA carboxylase alpha subunit